MAEISAEAASVPTRKRKKGGGVKFLFVVLITLALIAVVVYHFSVLNSMKYFLVPEDGKLHVKQGVLFVTGNEPFKGETLEETALYSPIDLPAKFGHVQKEFGDRSALNYAYATILIDLTHQLVFSPVDTEYSRGKSYLTRLDRLQGLKPDQVKLIIALNADVDYIEAKRAFVGVEKTLERALKKFKQAETYGTGRFADAPEWIGKVNGLLQVIRATKNRPLPAPVDLVPAPGADLRPEADGPDGLQEPAIDAMPVPAPVAPPAGTPRTPASGGI